MSTQAKKTAAKKPPSHPSFKEMIVTAITELAEKKGSSRHAIKKYVVANNKVSEQAMKANFNKVLSKMVANDVLHHPKTGKGTYKVTKAKASEAADKGKKRKAVAKRKPAAAKKSEKDSSKKAVAKKPKTKKAPAKKTAVKKSTVKKTPSKKHSAKKTAAKRSPKKPAKKQVKKTASNKK